MSIKQTELLMSPGQAKRRLQASATSEDLLFAVKQIEQQCAALRKTLGTESYQTHAVRMRFQNIANLADSAADAM